MGNYNWKTACLPLCTTHNEREQGISCNDKCLCTYPYTHSKIICEFIKSLANLQVSLAPYG